MRALRRRWPAMLLIVISAWVAAAIGVRRQGCEADEVSWRVPAAGRASGVRMAVLVDSGEFMARLEEDLRDARRCVCLQAMSFEGDDAGGRIARALAACPAPCKQLLVDSYSRFVISDKFRLLPKHWDDDALRRENDLTRRTLATLRRNNVAVKLTNPMDPLLVRFMARNHKKMVVIDDRVGYLGGINFCDHNFAWHDMMIRIESDEAAGFLREDFLSTWRGVNQSVQRDFGGLWLAMLDGRCNERSLAPVVRAIGKARRSIVVESGYVSFPFFGWLRAARERGVSVVLLTPELNNKPLVKDYLLWEATRAGFEIRLYPGRMSHLKAMLIDDATLVAGSSNFDYIAHTVQQEVVMVVTDPDAVEEFRANVLGPDLDGSIPYTGHVSALGGWPRYAAMRAAATVMVGLVRVLESLVGTPEPEWAEEWRT